MKLLWLSAGLLLPLDKGGKLRSWHLLRHLAAMHDVPISPSTISTAPNTAPACGRCATDSRRSAARTLVTDHYDWSAVAHDFESGIARLAGFSRPPLTFTGPDRRKTRRDGLAAANFREA